MKSMIMCVFLAAMALSPGAPGLYAADDFLPRLESALLQLGLQERETALIMTAARERNWQAADPEFAEMAALSLKVCERARSETQAREQVELIYNLAAMNREMRALGFTRREIARIALNASRDVAERLRLNAGDGAAAGQGDMIRDRIRARLCEEGLASQEARIMERIRERIRQNGPERGHGSP
ncbi:MAG: hypothetical protein JXD23_08210 [Spirochaetales bacterium]|nr:hypothetical protein [Spirochaetales bacterium]